MIDSPLTLNTSFKKEMIKLDNEKQRRENEFRSLKKDSFYKQMSPYSDIWMRSFGEDIKLAKLLKRRQKRAIERKVIN